MYEHEGEMYADVLSDVSYLTSDSSDEDSGSEIIVKRKRHPLRPVLEYSTENDNSSDEELERWSRKDKAFQAQRCMEETGLQIPLNECDVRSTMELFLADDLMDLFVTETNRYYKQQKEGNKEMKNKQWTDTDVSEMKKFLGLLLVMELVKKTEKDEYWSTDPLICTPVFAKIMSRDRFRQIWRYWHFNNNKNCKERFDKVKPVIDNLKNKFQTIYKPEKELSLDEIVIPWKETLSLRAYKPNKIIKYGILVRVVCEAVSGYVCNFEMYCAQGLKLQETLISVLNPYLHLWHDVYMDNYYNSTKLAQELLRKRTNICGTIRENRGVPKSLKTIKLKENSTDFRRKNRILIQAFRTKKQLLYMMSTIHSAKMLDISHSKSKNPILKPICIIDYNNYMQGVHHVDQYSSYDSIMQKTKKWTKKTVLYLINTALFNAHAVYVKYAGHNQSLKKFKLAVAHLLLNTTAATEEAEPDTTLTHTVRAPKHDPVDRLCPEMQKHKIVRILGKGKVENPRRACRVCAAAKKRSSTAFMCSSCNVPLHVGRCYEVFHTKTKY